MATAVPKHGWKTGTSEFTSTFLTTGTGVPIANATPGTLNTCHDPRVVSPGATPFCRMLPNLRETVLETAGTHGGLLLYPFIRLYDYNLRKPSRL